MKTINDYAELVKEKHALNKTIAPVETNETDASRAYAVGEQLIFNGTLYDVIAPISQHDVITTTGSGANIAPAGSISAKIQTLTNQLTNEVTTRAALGAHNLFGVGNSLDEWFAATNDGKLPTSYLASETITGTVDKDTNSIVITAYNNTGYRWGCKKINLKKNTSYTFSRTSCDGTIQLFGKNNADDRAVVISGLSNGGTVNSGDYDWWYVGFYPTRSGGYFSITDLLVKLETDADTTFQSYAKTNQELTAENQTLTQNVDNEIATRVQLGAHQLLNYDLASLKARNTSGTWNNNVYTPTAHPNLSFTVNSDLSISVSGTSSNAVIALDFSSQDFGATDIFSYDSEGVPVGDYILTSNIPNGGANGNICLRYASSTHNTSIVVWGNQTVNVTVKPLIRYKGDPSTMLTPYAMTNRELTEKSIIKDVSGYSWESTVDGSKDITVKQYGAIVLVYGYFNSTTSLAQYANILTGLPHCASGASLSADIAHNMGMTLQNVNSATSKIIVNGATTANLQYAFSFVYLTDK